MIMGSEYGILLCVHTQLKHFKPTQAKVHATGELRNMRKFASAAPFSENAD